jgi:hypothetical protein
MHNTDYVCSHIFFLKVYYTTAGNIATVNITVIASTLASFSLVMQDRIGLDILYNSKVKKICSCFFLLSIVIFNMAIRGYAKMIVKIIFSKRHTKGISVPAVEAAEASTGRRHGAEEAGRDRRDGTTPDSEEGSAAATLAAGGAAAEAAAEEEAPGGRREAAEAGGSAAEVSEDTKVD